MRKTQAACLVSERAIVLQHLCLLRPTARLTCLSCDDLKTFDIAIFELVEDQESSLYAIYLCDSCGLVSTRRDNNAG